MSKANNILLIRVTLLFAITFMFTSEVYSQNSLSFKANQGRYQDSYAEYYYKIIKNGNKYRLIDPKKRDVLQKECDTIVKNKHFIKTIIGDSITIYRCNTLKKIKIHNIQQVYFFRNGLEVLSKKGAQYYDNNISEIDNFTYEELFKCGTVYSESYRLKQDSKTKKYSLNIEKGDFGATTSQLTLGLKGLPDNIDKLSFLNDKTYVTKSINNDYNPYPLLIKVTKNGKDGIYTYNLENAIYPKKKKSPKKKIYTIDTVTRDTIYVPEIIEPIYSLNKKGTIAFKEVLPIVYNQIQQNTNTGLIYLYKDNKIGIYPDHINTSFSVFDEKTTSFYKITKNEKQGWLDIKTFKEYYFD